MNLKKALVTGLAAFGLMASLAAPVALAQPAESTTSNNSTTAFVTVTTDGVFDVYFNVSQFSLGTVNLNANTPEANATGSVVVYYTDTMANRPNFNVQMTASNFQNVTTNLPGDVISATNFQVTHAYNVQQGYWSGNAPGGIDIGDIGYFVNGVYVAQSSGGGAWTGTTNLSTGPTVQFGYAGSGTSWSSGALDVKLKVPSTTVAGQYNSNVTLSVIAGTQP